ncbi:hypothetical protein F8388_003958, partial [Cannabis sativa]
FYFLVSKTSFRVYFVRNLIKKVVGDKSALKVAKRKLGTHKREKKRRRWAAMHGRQRWVASHGHGHGHGHGMKVREREIAIANNGDKLFGIITSSRSNGTVKHHNGAKIHYNRTTKFA